MEDNGPEASLVAVEISYRLRLPQSLCKRVRWLAGDKPLRAWLLLGNPERCRLLSTAEVDNDPDLRVLRSRIAEEVALRTSPIEFRSEVSAILPLRLAEIQITHHETSGWRLILPKHLAALMRIRAGESQVVALLIQGRIELWTEAAFRSAATPQLSELVQEPE